MKLPADEIKDIETQTAWAVWIAVLIVPAIVIFIDWLLN